MCRLRFPGILLVASFLAAGCGVEDTVVARVGDIEVHDERVMLYLETVTGTPWAEVDSKVASRLFDQFLEQEAVISALGDEFQVTPDEPIGRSMFLRRFAKDVCGPPPTVAPEEVEAAVKIRMIEVVPEQVLICQMLLPDLAEAQAARARLDQGEKFSDLSREISTAPNAESGGGIGWVVRGTQPEDIEAEIFSLNVGEVSRPVKSTAGYHLFQALGVRPSGRVSEDKAVADVRRDLESALSREHLSRCIDQAVDHAGVVIFKENLWFDYRGRFAED